MRSILLILAALLTATPAFARPMVEVNTCGQEVPKGYLGYLAADLDCTGDAAAVGGLRVRGGGVLDLRGFTLTSEAVFGVYCGSLDEHGGVEPCSVMNGTITGGQSGHGIIAKRLNASNLVIDGAAVMGIASDGPLKGTNLTISGSGECGVRAGATRLAGSTITGNGEFGVCGKKIRLFDSTVTGNVLGDLISPKRPLLKNSTCGTSVGPISPFTWDVCTDD